MAKRHCRPSAQYRYEHYDPRLDTGRVPIQTETVLNHRGEL
jgi:hypothetical protein